MPRYTVVLEPDVETGQYGVLVPALPGCFSQGDSVEEALANIREAISLHLGSMRRDGEPFPADVTPIVTTVEAEPVEPGPVDPALLAELDRDEATARPSAG